MTLNFPSSINKLLIMMIGIGLGEKGYFRVKLS